MNTVVCVLKVKFESGDVLVMNILKKEIETLGLDCLLAAGHYYTVNEHKTRSSDPNGRRVTGCGETQTN